LPDGLLNIPLKIFEAMALVWVTLIFAVVPAQIDWRKWRKAIRLLGLSSAIRSAGRVARFRYRQPWRDVRVSAPGPPSAILLCVATLLYVQWSGSISDFSIGFAAVAVIVAVLQPIGAVAPPIVLFLAISDYDQFRLMKRMQSLGDLLVLSLINQSSRGVVDNYHEHYRRQAAIARRSGIVGRAVALGRVFGNPMSPRHDSLRTRPEQWRDTLHEAIEVSPVVVLDARDYSRYVLEEALWMLAPERINKCLFLVKDDRSAPVLERAASFGEVLSELGVNTVTEGELPGLLLERTQSSQTLSPLSVAPPHPDSYATLHGARRRFELMSALLEDFQACVSRGDGSDPRLDARIWEWDRGRGEAAISDDLPRYTDSIDAALSLARRHLAQDGATCSFSVYVDIKGLGSVSIGLQSRPGNMRVFESDPFRIGPARAMLQALFRGLLA
jgi:hypothetical protein